MKPSTSTPMQKLRRYVNLFDNCNEDFNSRFTIPELIKIAEMHATCGWDFYPDQWTDRQVKEALQGILPQWDSNERPSYSEGGVT